MPVRVEHGDMLEVLARMVAAGTRVHAVVTDPPYHLTAGKRGGSGEASMNVSSPAGRSRISTGFMGRAWDGGDIAFRAETWRLCFDLLPPGGHLLAFSGTRTFHRMVVAIEDAGFEIRDTIAWLYGSGFPKSLNVSKAIDKAAGAEREVVSEGAPVKRMIPGADQHKRGWEKNNGRVFVPTETAAATEAARQWEGWGTALKPSHELVCVAQKPHGIATQLDMIGSTIWSLERKIWSLLPANVATELFGLSPSELDAACVSAQWSADERSSTRAALCDLMGTSRFALATLSSLNTVSSWLECLGAHLRHANTSIIETESSTTIDLKIWKSCLSRITPASIILAHKSGAWCGADAEPAERFLNADVLRWLATRELSVLESASASDATRSLVEEGQPKPLAELICVARKPLDGTVAANVLAHGTGALNIDGCRVATSEDLNGGTYTGDRRTRATGAVSDSHEDAAPLCRLRNGAGEYRQPLGRWPANVAHDGSEEVVKAFPQSDGAAGAVRGTEPSSDNRYILKRLAGRHEPREPRGDAGSAARFFYSAKAGAADRLGSKHPTVKPVDLIRWLVRLVTPPGGTVLDPFAGSGTTGMACLAEGFDCVLVEREAEYVADIRRRIAHVSGGDTPLFSAK